MLVEGGDELEATRRVMDLVEDAPEEVRCVAEPMPPVEDERVRDVADQTGSRTRQDRGHLEKRCPSDEPTPHDERRDHRADVQRVQEPHAPDPRSDRGPRDDRPDELERVTDDSDDDRDDPHGLSLYRSV